MQRVFVIGVLLLGACGDGLGAPAAVPPATTVSPAAAAPEAETPQPIGSTTTSASASSSREARTPTTVEMSVTETYVEEVAIPDTGEVDAVLRDIDRMFGDFETSFNHDEGDVTQ